MPISLQDEVREALERKLFLPGTPVLRNANAQGSLNMLSCHNIQIGNSIEEIWQAAQHMALIFKSGGGGVGIELSKLAPRGTRLKYISPSQLGNGVATGPTSFLELYTMTGRLIGPARSGKDAGIMCLLSAHHEDVIEWVTAKNEDGKLELCNLSCSFEIGPDSVSADVWQRIVYQAWMNGTPGVAFLDNINDDNDMLEEYGPIETLNVCAENPAYSYEGCVLSSILLHNAVSSLGNWDELQRVARLQTLFLNRVVDRNHYPLLQFRESAHDLRRIGGGVMGFQTLLKREGIPMYSEEANAIGKEMARQIYKASHSASWELAKEEGGGYRPGCRRNVSLMAIAPNGHGAMLGNCSPSIYCNLYDHEEYREHLAATPEQHINHIAAWQGEVDGGVSYTVSIPNDSTPSRVDEIFRRAYDAGIKAVSVYRDQSRAGQPCTTDGSCSL